MSPRAERGPLIARSVRRAVDAAERSICGEGALDSLASVEGFALAGHRAARLHAGESPFAEGGVLQAPWVDHCTGAAAGPPALAFELTAVSGQQAVDHCLVAHRLAAYLGLPGRCTIDPALADSVELMRLPDADSIAGLPPPLCARIDDPAAAARAAFDEVERSTGRSLDRQALHLVGHGPKTVAPPSPERPQASTAPVAVGALPTAGLPVEDLLLDSVSMLEPPHSPLLDLGGKSLLPVVTVGQRHDDGRPLDLLLALRPSLLVGLAALERVRECGTLLVRTRSEEPDALWAELDELQRATIVRRRLRLAIVGPEANDRDAVCGAIVAALPELGAALGTEGDPVDRLTAAARSGAAALGRVDASRLEEPAAEQPTVEPTLPDGAASDAPERVAELRQFHFTGIAPDVRAPDPLLDEPLLPAILGAPELEPPPPSSSESGLLARWLESVLVERRRRRTAHLAVVAALAERLRARLGLPTGPAPEALAASLGAIGAGFVDAGALGERVGRPRRPADEEDERTRRLRPALDAMERGLRLAKEQPAAFVFSEDAGADRSALSLPSDVRLVPHPDGLRAAVGLFDGLAAEAVELARGTRIARLEFAGEYEDAVHAPRLARLDRASLTDDELFAIPAIVALETARDLRGPALAGMSELIRAGRPVHVLVSESVSALGRGPGYHPGLGYLAVAHREALVVQGSLCRPEHLARGLERAMRSIGPVVIIAAVAEADPEVSPQRLLEAALQGRATPCFVYDPEGGANWADRFSLEDNPQPDRAWPGYDVPILNERESFTFAHAAALDPAWRDHFLVIEPDSWNEDQIEMADYLELGERERSRRLPFVWVVRDGRFARALIRWELAFACRDRARAWHILQELAGTDNFYARRAAEEGRREAMQEADARAEQMESEFVDRLKEAQGRGAEGAVHRLVQLLADPAAYQAALEAGPGEAVPLPATPAPAVEAPPAAADEPAAGEAAPVLAPYIDSFLCTTCNDCIDLNPRMFRYNADKQAEIADASAGTFEQLVKAAEKCPARCIHPGVPREGDKSATAKLIERAAKFQ